MDEFLAELLFHLNRDPQNILHFVIAYLTGNY